MIFPPRTVTTFQNRSSEAKPLVLPLTRVEVTNQDPVGPDVRRATHLVLGAKEFVRVDPPRSDLRSPRASRSTMSAPVGTKT